MTTKQAHDYLVNHTEEFRLFDYNGDEIPDNLIDADDGTILYYHDQVQYMYITTYECYQAWRTYYAGTDWQMDYSTDSQIEVTLPAGDYLFMCTTDRLVYIPTFGLQKVLDQLK